MRYVDKFIVAKNNHMVKFTKKWCNGLNCGTTEEIIP